MTSRILAHAAALVLLLAGACDASAAGPQLAVGVEHFVRGNLDPIGSEVRILNSTGGIVQTLHTATGLDSPSWSRDDSMLAYRGLRIMLRPATGGAETPLVVGNNPSWSPVADELAYWAFTTDASGVSRTLRVIGANGAHDRAVAGPFTTPGGGPIAWSRDGKRLAFTEPYDGPIVTVDAGGGGVLRTVVPLTPGVRLYNPAYAPNGKRIAYLRYYAQAPVRDQLVVRDLATQAEKVVGEHPWGAPPLFVALFPAISWSADSERIAAVEYGSPSTYRVLSIKADGSSRNVLMETTAGQDSETITGVAWANSRGPSYFIKHVEVTQAISSDFVLPPDTVLPDEYTYHWSEPSAFGFRLPLIAEKSTLLRIYIGDATLPAGVTKQRALRVSVVDDTSTQYGPPSAQAVDVTAQDVAPQQGTAGAAVNVWVPPEVAKAGGANSFRVEVNVGEQEPECDGCYPHGNRATVEDIRYSEGGGVVIAPVPIYLITPDSKTVLQPAEAEFKSTVAEAIPMLPVRDEGVTISPSPGGLLVEQKDLTPDDGCAQLVERLLVLRATPGIAGPLNGFGATRWVGYAPPVLPPKGAVFCPGKADSTPGRNLVLLGTDPIVLAHELGHTLGLTHATGRNPRIVPGGAIPLPYAGIGGVGTLNGVAGVTEVFPSATRGDLMSYDTNRWTSPKTWAVMHRRILDEGGTIKTQAASSPRARAAVRTPGTPAVRRVVSGILRGTDTTLDSLVTEASAPKGTGPVAARVIARNARGKKLASADIRGVPEQEEGETSAALPFVIDLPNKKRIASLQVLPSRGGKPLVRLRASRHAPTGRFVKLPRRARAKRPLNLRWTASDRDPRDELSTLLLARRGKSTWRTIVLGPGVGRLAVNPSTLGNGKALRLRLRISDGFRTSVVNARKITLR